jgi:septal ring factor EnvC (AmiA/AmiB activator)
MPTQAERLAALEARQKGHEEKVSVEIMNLSERVDSVEQGQARLEPAISSINTQLAVVVERLGEPKQSRMELREWLNLIAVIAGPIVAVWVAVGMNAHK